MKTLALFIYLALSALSAQSESVDSLIGTRPPEWNVTNWLNSAPLQLKDLRGKVVLVRWWTAPTCPYCKATAPALNEFDEQFSKQGLQVIGFYHHKEETALRLEDVKRYAEKYKFNFPIAVDPDWQTLNKWWLSQDGQKWTSVSFLIDRKGVIRHLHPGGQYVKGDKDYGAMKTKIQELLAEK